ncbi:MAG: amine oxidase, partial [Actinobacteria bacterium]|nr:amine oxidase [Actinomycetota bacterium]
TWYHSVNGSSGDFSHGKPALVIDGAQRGPLVNSVAISAAAPSYAPRGKVLISSSALGSHTTTAADAAALSHAGQLHSMKTSDWELVGKFVIPNALPNARSPLTIRQEVRLGGGRYVAGDHLDTPSIQGALVSGRRAAAAVVADLR